ncbi:MAG TPA: prenyltransferase/squalene oxidase repeat-containing protein [Planctomycetota bacterium]|nr:prenyltransferase/squalene oxidase repeat-containing protein [Planctomycetota bacterium]
MANRLGFAFIVVLAAGSVQAQEFRPKGSKIPTAEIDGAIRKGLVWLKAVPARTGVPSNRIEDTNELVLYTLLHGGIPPGDPALADVVKQTVDREPDRVYNVALGAMALARMDRAGYQWKIAHQAQFLVDNQCENGQWAYGSPVDWDPRATGEWMVQKSAPYGTKYPPGWHPSPGKASNGRKIAIRQRARVTKTGDNSNAQYAALGLRACAEADVQLDPRCLQEALHWWESDQNKDGGWGYSRGEDDAGRATMTAGGIGSLVIFRWMLHKPWVDQPPVKRGMEWLDANVKGRLPKWNIYYLYGVERAGMLYGTDLIGTKDWYDDGAEWLIEHQAENGSWRNVTDTCFAILFLKRATSPLPGVATPGAGSK